MKLSENARRLRHSLNESVILMEAVIVRADPEAYLFRVCECLERQGYELPDVVETAELVESLDYILEHDKRLVEFAFLKKAVAAIKNVGMKALPPEVHKKMMMKHSYAANDAMDAMGQDVEANSANREKFISHHVAKFAHMKAHDPKRHYVAAKDAMNNGLPPVGTKEHASALWYMAQKMRPVLQKARNRAPDQEFRASARRERERAGAEAGTENLSAHDSHTQLTKSGGESKGAPAPHVNDSTGVLKVTPQNGRRTQSGLKKSDTGTVKYGSSAKGDTKIYGK